MLFDLDVLNNSENKVDIVAKMLVLTVKKVCIPPRTLPHKSSCKDVMKGERKAWSEASCEVDMGWICGGMANNVIDSRPFL